MKLTISRYTAISILCMAFATTASARSWRIHHNTKQLADFTDINAACASDQVQEGDTLYLDPGCLLTAGQAVTKRLTIIGCGYEGVTQPYAFATISGALNLQAAGIKVMSAIMSGVVTIKASDITIERCRINSQITNSSTCTNATIRQCYFTNSNYNECIVGPGSTTVSNWTIENCIIDNINNRNVITGLHNATIRNNLIIGKSSNNSSGAYYMIRYMGTCQITNNIIIDTADATRVFESNVNTEQTTNNVISQDISGEYNRANVLTLDSIYTGDIQSYTLKEDSPAKGYATDGGDCGPFGGMYPYVKGGRPFGHPYYTDFKVASRPDENDKLKVSLKIKMNDE